KFRADMARWWYQVNPDWRERSGAGFVLTRGDGDLSGLFCTGQNGLVSVVKCLKFWWEMFDDPSLEEQEPDRREWMMAADDVAWTFEKLHEQMR
ncbi:hypothetical protein FB107DRAFT_224774, partial [Schizophyllum commune]